MYPRVLIFFAVLCFVFASRLVAQDVPQYLSRFWETDEGLSDNWVQAVTQTHDGWIWVGTRNGLLRFDGLRFTRMDEKLFPDLKTRSFVGLHQSRDGNLWIATGQEGVLCWNAQTTLRFSVTNGLPDNRTRAICEAKDGSIWIGTAAGLARFRSGKFDLTLTKETGLPHETVRSLSEDHSGKLWIGTGVGLAVFDGEKITQPLSDEIAKTVNVVCWEQTNRLWLGLNKGLMRIDDGTNATFVKKDGLADNFVSAFHVSGNQLWIGTLGGLNRMSDQAFLTETLADGTAYDQVNSIFQDRENNIWIATKSGLAQLTPRAVTMIGKREGLSHNNVTCLSEDVAGRMWMGTWGGGPNFWRGGKNDFVTTRNIATERILSLCHARDGSLWCGADYNHGVYRIYSNTVTRYTSADGLEAAAVRVIYEDRSTNLWIGTSRSLHLFRDGKFTRFTKEDGLPGNTIRAIAEDRNGDFWIGTENGFARKSHSGFVNFNVASGLSHNVVSAFYCDPRGDLWIGTEGGGINRFRNGKFTSYTTADGLFSDTAFEIIEDDFGFFWMSCLNGIYRVRKQSFEDFDAGKIKTIPCAIYNKSDGMTTSQCNGVSKPAAWKSNDGRLWFATIKGVAVIDPAKLQQNELPPPVFVVSLQVDKQVIGIATSSADDRTEPAIVLKPRNRDLEIRYTALSFVAPEKNQFRYQLQGHDVGWVDAGERRVAYYNNLAPGSYTFVVTACNNDGVWNLTGDSIRLVLHPHFWETWWFQSGGALGLFGMVGGVVRVFTKRRLQRKLAQLEQQHALEKERGRIAQDLHDDLGSRLTQILLLSRHVRKSKSKPEEVDLHVSKITHAAEQVIDDLHAIVWAVNPKNDSLDKLIAYISEQAQSFMELSSIACRFDVPENLPALPISSQTRHNFFLVIKEALNNIVKHSDATEVRITCDLNDGILRFTLVDNGKGFSLATNSASGNGLENMKDRVSKFGGEFRLESAPGKGTRVEVVMRLRAGPIT